MKRSSKRIAVLVGGWALLLVGTALLVLPGPGLPLLLAGLALLGREQPWARRIHVSIRRRWDALRRRVRPSGTPVAPVAPVTPSSADS